MIPVPPVPEPPTFNEKARVPGNRWLAKHSSDAKSPQNYWSQFKPQLADAFGYRCAYCTMWISDGTVDHFISCHEDRSQAYEWGNYRYCLGSINSRKGATPAGRLLDPYEVQEGWFKIILPSLELQVSDTVPQQFREQAHFVLDKLGLNNESMVDLRCEWYRMYTSEELNLDGLRKKSPLDRGGRHKGGNVLSANGC